GGFAAEQFHILLAHLTEFGEKLDQVLVRLAIDRWGGNADLEGLTVQANDFVGPGLGLKVTVENQQTVTEFNGAGHGLEPKTAEAYGVSQSGNDDLNHIDHQKQQDRRQVQTAQRRQQTAEGAHHRLGNLVQQLCCRMITARCDPAENDHADHRPEVNLDQQDRKSVVEGNTV